MTSPSRADRLWKLLNDYAQRDGSVVNAKVVCAVAVELLKVTGASLTVIVDPARWDAPTTSDALSAELEELQFTLGEGPGSDAMSRGGPVIVADLAEQGGEARWPVFTAAAVAAGAAAMFVFPLTSGAIRLGVLALYRVKSGPLSPDLMKDAIVLAELALLVLLHAADGVSSDGRSWTGQGLSVGRQQVYQATGMISAQLDVGLDEALVRLRAYAFGNERTLAEVAGDVVARRLRFSPEPV
ncbi:MAG: GAF and ANTAR domain-containing protein [Actinocatenispora sp.]